MGKQNRWPKTSFLIPVLLAGALTEARAQGNEPQPGAGVPMPGADVPMPGADIPMPGADVPMPGADVPMPGADVPMPGTDAPVTDSRIADSRAAGASAPPAASFFALSPTRWSLNGYVEDTLTLEYRRDTERLLPINATRTRLNLSGQPNAHLDFNVGLVGLLYTGHTQIALAPYLPDTTRATLYPGNPAAGLPSAETFLTYPLDNQLYLQEAFGTLYAPHIKIRAGRQKFYTGNGYAYDPIDLFNRKDPLDPTYEVDGIDAVLAVLELPAQLEMQGLVRLDRRIDRSDYLGRIKTSLEGWDLAVQYTYLVDERTDWQAMVDPLGVMTLMSGAPPEVFTRRFVWHLVAAEATGDIGGVGVHAQGGYAFVEPIGDAGTLAQAAKDHERLLVGADYTFDCELFVMAEYMRLGQGRAQSSDIDLNDRMALFSGNVLAINRDTVFAGISYPLTDLSEIALYAIVGLNDPSATINPWLSFDLYPGLRLWLTGYVPVGEPTSQNGEAGPGGFARLRFSF